MPPTEVGTIQLYPAAFATAAVEKRYCLAPQVLLIKVCVIAVGVVGNTPEIVNTNVAIESHPKVFVNVSVYVPAAVML
jgi:hypothetical protein